MLVVRDEISGTEDFGDYRIAYKRMDAGKAWEIKWQ